MPRSSFPFVRVLLVEDDDIYRDYLAIAISNALKCEIRSAGNADAAIAILNAFPIDCVIMDYELGAENGLYVGELIKKAYTDPPPMVMLSARAKERTIIKAYRGGFSDFVSKLNASPDELIGAIRGAIERKAIARAETTEHARLAGLSFVDVVTGLHNAEYMRGRTEELTASAGRQGGNCAAILVRPRELVGVGDTFGLALRDRALRAFASRLQRVSRDTDFFGQHAADSFLYLIDRNVNPETILAACERLARDLSFVVNFDSGSFTFTTEIGAALFPHSATSAEMLLASADRALALARSTGVRLVIAPPIDFVPGLDPESAPQVESVGKTETIPFVQSGLTGERHQDRRAEVRHRVLKRGIVLMDGAKTAIDCTIRDISNGGARIRLVENHYLPDRFELMIVESGVKRSVALRWRKSLECGLQFLP